MKKLVQLVILITVSLFMHSCYYDSIYEPIADDSDNGGEPDIVSYQNDIIPLWVQCVGCHNGNEPPDLRDDVSYNNLLNGFVVPGNAEASTLYKSLLNLDGVPLMPPGGQWPDSKINLVKDWIDQGALPN